MKRIALYGWLLLFACISIQAEDLVHYSGRTLSNVDYHHGQLTPAIGVHNRQIMRACRERPLETDGFGWTYNHAPMMAYWNKTFFVEYLSDPVGEHVPPAQTLLIRSADQGQTWSKPAVIFPSYKVPDGTTKEGSTIAAKNLMAVMHQRVGFYVSKSGKLLVLAFYGISLGPGDDPNDGNGIGRVVREIKADGSYGPIYFLHYNHAFNETNTDYPFFKRSKDKPFVAACNEILTNPLYMLQMVEESDRNDPLIPLKKQYKAFSYYHLPDGRVIGLWKNALTSVSRDGGKTWYEPVTRAQGFVNSNAKIWGQRTSDGRYATVYNPSEFRWPLAVSVSQDGLNYTNLLLVNGEISPMRYGGAYKSYGPQYVRGIQENNGTPPDGKLWVTYSMNKEDIWVASVPVPIVSETALQANDLFDQLPDGKELEQWNTYSPLWAPVGIERNKNYVKCLVLRDKDPFDYAKAERVIPESHNFKVVFSIEAAQSNHGRLDIEFQNAQGNPAIRLSLMPDGYFRAKAGARLACSFVYQPAVTYQVEVLVHQDRRAYDVNIDGKKVYTGLFFAPVASFSRIVFRTGEPRLFPTPETPADRFSDLEQTGAVDPEAIYYIQSLKTEPL
ncbi:MAG: exo-alpha-sialidase [Bacteroidota bacterium]|nr:exo-alpha-sialidase [Bacteroidota bacterium]